MYPDADIKNIEKYSNCVLDKATYQEEKINAEAC